VSEKRPRILVADDHALVLEALVVLLTPVSDIVGTATDGASLLALVAEHQPDLVITDLSMPEVSGFEVLRKIRQRSAHIPVLVLTMHHDIGTLRMAMAGGAAGYLLKSAVSEELVDAVRTVWAGDRYITPTLREAFTSAPPTDLEQLSPRQRAVLEELAAGRSTAEIAERLGISERTVAFHKENLRKRLGVQSAVAMVDLLRRAGSSETR